MKGKLIVLEGGEGVGKTTQIKLLFDYLKTYSCVFQELQKTGRFTDVVTTIEPGGSNICSQIRSVILQSYHEPYDELVDSKTELLLYAADRAQHVNKVLKPALEEGCLVLCDRYIYSTIAYQGYGRGVDLDLIHQLNEIATDGLTPDLTIWLDANPSVALKRVSKRGAVDRIEDEKLEFHEKVRYGYQTIWDADTNQTFKRIDASRDPKIVFQDIRRTLYEYLADW
jgi:dTMP kinase